MKAKITLIKILCIILFTTFILAPAFSEWDCSFEYDYCMNSPATQETCRDLYCDWVDENTTDPTSNPTATPVPTPTPMPDDLEDAMGDVDGLEEDLEGTGEVMDVALESGDTETLDEGNAAATQAGTAATDITGLAGEAGEVSAETDLENSSNGETVDGDTNEGAAPTAGDPVRLATGEYVFDEKDLGYRYYQQEISIDRGYQSNNLASHSFGQGWTFNYDTRIVRGVKSNAITEVERLTQKAESSWQLYNDGMAALNAILPDITIAFEDADNAYAQADNLLQDALAAQDAAYDLSSSYPETAGIRVRADALLISANNLFQQASEHFNTVSDLKADLEEKKTQLESLYTVCESLDSMVE